MMTVPDLATLFQAISSRILLGGIFALSALGLSLVLGVMRLVNLVHGELVVLGSYLAVVLLDMLGLDPLLALLLVFVCAVAVAYPAHRVLLAPASRGGDEGPLLATFALSIIIQNIFIRLFSGDTRPLDRPYARTAIHLFGVNLPAVYLAGFAVSLTVTTVVHLLMTRTGFGRRLRASAEDPGAAAIVGVAVARVHALIYALGAGLAAIGGVPGALRLTFSW